MIIPCEQEVEYILAYVDNGCGPRPSLRTVKQKLL